MANTSLIDQYRRAKFATVAAKSMKPGQEGVGQIGKQLMAAGTQLTAKKEVEKDEKDTTTTTTDTTGTTTTTTEAINTADEFANATSSLTNIADKVAVQEGSLTSTMFKENNQPLADQTLFVETDFQTEVADVVGDLTGDEAINALVESGIDQPQAEKLYKKYSEFVESGEDPSKINDIVNANANEAIANMEIVNNDMKAIRKELSQFVIGASGKVSNYANKGRTPVFQNVATEFLNAETVKINEDTGEYEVYSSTLDKYLTKEDILTLMKENRVDAVAQNNVQKLINNIGREGQADASSPQSRTEPPPIGSINNKVANIIDNAENFNSLVYDDLIGNGSSFAEDLKQHPTFREFRRRYGNVDFGKAEAEGKLDSNKFRLEKGEKNWYDNVSEEDLEILRDEIVNNPDNEGLARELLKSYVSKAALDQYEKNNKRRFGRQFKSEAEEVLGADATPEDYLNYFRNNKTGTQQPSGPVLEDDIITPEWKIGDPIPEGFVQQGDIIVPAPNTTS